MNTKKVNFIGNKVIINDKEIVSLKKFFSLMEKLNYDRYCVEYDEETDKFEIVYNYTQYEEVYFGKNVDESVIKHLINLALLRKMYREEHDLTKIEESQDINDAKKFYLTVFKKNKFSIKKYINNFINDIRKSKSDTKRDFNNNLVIYAIVTIISVIVSSIILWPTLTSIPYFDANSIIFSYIFGSFLVFPTFNYLFNHVKNRLNRLKKCVNDRKIKNSKVKEIEASLVNTKELTDENDGFKIEDNILKMIDNLSTKLEGINLVARAPLRQELSNILDDYLAFKESNLSYSEEFIKRREIISRIGTLEGNINILKPSKKIDNVIEEAEYVKTRINSLESGSTEPHKVYRKSM